MCNDDWDEQFLAACYYGTLDVVTSLHANVSEDALQSGFETACARGATEVVDFLLRNSPVDPGKWCSRSIRRAARFGHAAIVRRLLEDPRVRPRAINHYALCVALRYGHDAVIEALCRHPSVVIEDAFYWLLAHNVVDGLRRAFKLTTASPDDYNCEPYIFRSPYVARVILAHGRHLPIYNFARDADKTYHRREHFNYYRLQRRFSMFFAS